LLAGQVQQGELRGRVVFCLACRANQIYLDDLTETGSRSTAKSGAPQSGDANSSREPVAVPSKDGVVYLDDLKEIEFRVGHGTLGKHSIDHNGETTNLSFRGEVRAPPAW
jgi:hypothetical protein